MEWGIVCPVSPTPHLVPALWSGFSVSHSQIGSVPTKNNLIGLTEMLQQLMISKPTLRSYFARNKRLKIWPPSCAQNIFQIFLSLFWVRQKRHPFATITQNIRQKCKTKDLENFRQIFFLNFCTIFFYVLCLKCNWAKCASLCVIFQITVNLKKKNGNFKGPPTDL